MFLLNLVPFWYRWAAIGVLVIAVWGHGYVKGGEAAEEKLEATKAAIQAQRDRDALRSAKKVIHDKEVLSETVSDFHQNISAINAYWLRQRKAAAGMPANPAPSNGIATRCADSIPLGQYQELEQACAVTTQMFNSCRNAWIMMEGK